MNLNLQVPYGYQTATRSLAWVRDWLLTHHHPEYVRRIVPWLDSKGGAVGIGGGWRPDGTQPNLSGFAPEGKSFHQNQRFIDGFIGATAVDLVAKDGPDGNNSHDMVAWSMVPAQGSAEAKRWGVHCNISGESWHMQPVEIDGWQSWINAGCPAPKLAYPLPVDPPVPVPETPPVEPPPVTHPPLEAPMLFATRVDEPDGSLKHFALGSPLVGWRFMDRPTINVFLQSGQVIDLASGRTGFKSGDSLTAVDVAELERLLGQRVA